MKKYILCASIVVLVMFLIPWIVQIASPKISSEITADGILNYACTCVAAITTTIIAIIAVWQTNRANELSEKAIEISRSAEDSSKVANEISNKLLELEEFRQEIEIKPTFAVSNWKAVNRSFDDVNSHSKCLNINVGKYSNGMASGIELEIMNTSSGYETIWLNKACNKTDTSDAPWVINMSGNMNSYKLELPQLHTGSFFFYADNDYWVNRAFPIVYEFSFHVRNRLDMAYIAKFDMMIINLDLSSDNYFNEPLLHLVIQNYRIEKYEDEGPI